MLYLCFGLKMGNIVLHQPSLPINTILNPIRFFHFTIQRRNINKDIGIDLAHIEPSHLKVDETGL